MKCQAWSPPVEIGLQRAEEPEERGHEEKGYGAVDEFLEGVGGHCILSFNAPDL